MYAIRSYYVGLLGEEANTISAPSLPTQSLLSPQTIAIAGVSSKAGSFGTLIFNNILDSQIDKKNIIVIKPGSEEFQGIPCVITSYSIHYTKLYENFLRS